MNMIRASGDALTAGSDELSSSLHWHLCVWALQVSSSLLGSQASSALVWVMGIFSVCWNGLSASGLSVHWNFSSGILVSSAERPLGFPGSRVSPFSTSCLYCGVREGPEWVVGKGVLAGHRICRNHQGTVPWGSLLELQWFLPCDGASDCKFGLNGEALSGILFFTVWSLDEVCWTAASVYSSAGNLIQVCGTSSAGLFSLFFSFSLFFLVIQVDFSLCFVFLIVC